MFGFLSEDGDICLERLSQLLEPAVYSFAADFKIRALCSASSATNSGAIDRVLAKKASVQVSQQALLGESFLCCPHHWHVVQVSIQCLVMHLVHGSVLPRSRHGGERLLAVLLDLLGLREKDLRQRLQKCCHLVPAKVHNFLRASQVLHVQPLRQLDTSPQTYQKVLLFSLFISLRLRRHLLHGSSSESQSCVSILLFIMIVACFHLHLHLHLHPFPPYVGVDDWRQLCITNKTVWTELTAKL